MSASKQNKGADEACQRTRELVDWLDVVREALATDSKVSTETKAEIQMSLLHAEAALRRGLAERSQF
ncbi:MAG: hypothetical protein AAFO74_14315 [Pseudomonadota bacterium]